MKSFCESLAITKNYKLLEHLVLELNSFGIDSSKFLDWYFSEGLVFQGSGLLSEGFDDWALKEGVFSSLFNRWTQGKDDKEKQNLDGEYTGYEKAGERIGSYAQKGCEFVGDQIARAKGRYNSFLQGIGGNKPDGQMKFPFYRDLRNAPVARSEVESLGDLSKRYQLSRELKSALGDEDFGRQIIDLINKVRSLKEHAFIEKGLVVLSSRGLDVESLVEWYSEERLNIQEGIGSWFQKAGNWLGGQWQNLKHAVRSWGEGDKDAAAQKDKRAVDNALMALNKLRSKYGNTVDQEFSSLLNTVLNKVEKLRSSIGGTQEPTAEKSHSGAHTSSEVGQYGDQPASLSVPGTGQAHVSGSVNDPHSAYQYVGKTKKLRPLKQPREKGTFAKSNDPFGVSSTQAGANAADYTSTFGDSDNHSSQDQKSFMESISPKSNKFSWFGY